MMSSARVLRSPYPWFGGKSRIMDQVWLRFGDVRNFVDPFLGSCAALLCRPNPFVGTETVNDLDGFVANFWRAVQADPESVVRYADWPVNENDMHARHSWLVARKEDIQSRIEGDHEWFDEKVAGWWVWGISCWIGSGWCSGKGPWHVVDGRLIKVDGNAGQGVNRKRPHLGDPGKGECFQRSEWLRGYLAWFADRLRRVRVCCGDWKRVCGPCVTFRRGVTGVFLDPPYADTAKRTKDLYATDCESVAHEVREWAIEQGANRAMRICLCGYDGEHDMPPDWSVVDWEASGGYGLISDDEDATGRVNRTRERLWFSPGCLKVDEQKELWG